MVQVRDAPQVERKGEECSGKIEGSLKKRAQWLNEKLTELFWMGKEVDAMRLEADGTEYLFLVGRRPKDWAMPVWRDWIVQPGVWPDAPGCGSLLIP